MARPHRCAHPPGRPRRSWCDRRAERSAKRGGNTRAHRALVEGAAKEGVGGGGALGALTRLGLPGVHSMDGARGFASLQRLHARGKLPLRVTYNLPLADLRHAERMGVRSGWGDVWLRFWGVKAFLDGSLGSRTAE